MKEIEMYKNARKPLEMNAKSGDKILIIADTSTEPAVWQVLMANAFQMGMDPTLALITPREYHQADPPPIALAAIYASDLTLLCTSTAMVHSPAASKAMEDGRRLICMEEVTSEMLIKGGCREDYHEMQKLAFKVRKIYTEGKKIRVTSDLGTDITASIEGRPGYLAAGKIEKQDVPLLAAAFPDGEVGIAPVEGTGEGVVVFDTTCHFLGRLSSPLKVKVSKGRAVSIEGDRADKLKENIDKFGDKHSHNFPAEIAIGLNSKVEVTGFIRTDKKLYGSVHIAFGMNNDVGGVTPGKLHIDGVIRYPDVTVDSTLIVSKGHLVNI